MPVRLATLALALAAVFAVQAQTAAVAAAPRGNQPRKRQVASPPASARVRAGRARQRQPPRRLQTAPGRRLRRLLKPRRQTGEPALQRRGRAVVRQRPDHRARRVRTRDRQRDARRRADRSRVRRHRSISTDAFAARLLTSSRAAIGARIALMESASREINVSSFIFSGDRAGRAVMAKLMEAAGRGREVRLMVDYVGSRVHRAQIKMLLEAGVEVGIYNPPSWKTLFLPHRMSWRLHDKLLIVDGKRMIIGGRNVEDGYFGKLRYEFRRFTSVLGLQRKRRVHQFSDTDVAVEGATARDANRYFEKLWRSANVKILDRSTYRAPAHEVQKVTRKVAGAARRLRGKWGQELRRSLDALSSSLIERASFVHDGTHHPKKDQRRGRQAIIELLDSARHEVEIQNPYVLPDRRLLRAIRRATSRGVKVRILTNGKKTSDGWLVYRAYESRLPALARAGAEVWEYGGPSVLHAKTVVVDRKRAYIGSHNLDPRSEILNREVGVIAESRPLAGQLLRNGRQRMKTAQRVVASGALTRLKNRQCGVACHWLGRRLLGSLLVVTGIYRQL